MDYEQIKQLMKDMENSKLESINIELADGTKISMKKEQNVKSCNQIYGISQNEMVNSNGFINNNCNNGFVNNTCNDISKNSEEESFKTVVSPMVGTFYSKASPSSKAFVKVGDKVKKGDVLCIIEAMKLMNEIESDVDGEIVEICCKEEEIVEYGTVLFKIR